MGCNIVYINIYEQLPVHNSTLREKGEGRRERGRWGENEKMRGSKFHFLTFSPSHLLTFSPSHLKSQNKHSLSSLFDPGR